MNGQTMEEVVRRRLLANIHCNVIVIYFRQTLNAQEAVCQKRQLSTQYHCKQKFFTFDFQDYRQEFNKTRSNVASIIERHDLLDSVHKDISDYQRNMSGSQGNKWNKYCDLMFPTNNAGLLFPILLTFISYCLGGPNNRRMELLLKVNIIKRDRFLNELL